ncbi:MAG: dihydroorotase [Caldisericia bacterium]|nr:dihydroorotase [Caldisericia bacterium]MDD5688972.1 dihydroorotase [Caldisericia bacterium]HOJ16070.1 dihydroorotase [Caldisericia bacterium]HOW02843.1 dihydroorotase [Caldisericia bacterium]HPO28812.1 dihydroorotase [Caldisericia bacterium]
MNIIIKNGNVYDSKERAFHKVDLLIKDNLIASIGNNLDYSDFELINAESFFVLPGFIDIHCHLREPGEEDKETIYTGTRAAAKGGFTRVVSMANTTPPIDSKSIYDLVSQKIEKDALINVNQAGTITENLRGRELSPLLKEGILKVYSDDGKAISNSKVFMEALECAKVNGSLLILHEEDKELSDDGLVNDGNISKRFRMKGIPACAESSILLRDLAISNYVDFPVHFTHLSSGQTVDILSPLKEEGINFTTDVTPHHLFFDEDDIDPTDTSFKVNPPIRSEKDRLSLIKGIKNGVINCIATDHAPHTKFEKSRDFSVAPFGISGIETAFSVSYTSLVKDGFMSFEDFIPLMTSEPAKILNINDEGEIFILKKANLTIVNLERYVLNEDKLISKGKNNPFIGFELYGFPVLTICEGRIVYAETNFWNSFR